MPDTVVAPTPRSTRSLPPVAVPLLVGAAVTMALGVYGRVHDPTGRTLYTLFFTDTIRLKAWLGTGCLVLASGQIFSALWLYGRLGRSGRPAPVWLGDVHRLTGTLTFALSLPVAYHCLWALGYQTSTARVAIHSLLGCALYGAFAAKVLAVRRPHQPVWALPVLGALTFTLLVLVWWTSALWFFRNVTWAP